MIDISVEVDAPIDDVWEHLSRIEDHVGWMADAEAIRFLSETQRGVGTEFECDTKIGPLRLTDEMVITEWQKPHRIGVVHRGLVTGAGLFVLSSIDLDRRTRVTWKETLELPWYFGGRLGERFGAQLALTPIWQRNLQRFKQQVEADATG